MPSLSVMIVDDDRDLAEGLAELLEIHGYTVAVAGNGREAVERFRDRDYDMTFMDVRMPVMNGVDSFFEIRKIKPEAKIVLMTGFKEEIVGKPLDAGAMGLLNKPFGVEALLDKISQTA
ncbi:MAG TPA: response regulator [Methylomirabilota bacterium]|nr:response regulator [Methylomirabilota bacterium]